MNRISTDLDRPQGKPRETGVTDESVSVLLLCFIALFSFWFFLPVILGGLYGDDVLNALTRGYIFTTFGSLFHMIDAIARGWIGTSRIYPLAFALTYTFWYVFGPNVLSAKIASIVITVITIATFAAMSSLVSRSRAVGVYTFVFATILMQVRVGFDPIDQFPPLMQVTALLIIFQIWQAWAYARTSQSLRLLACALAFALGMLTYELAIVAAPLGALIVWLRSRSLRRTALTSLAYGVVLVPYLAAVVLIRRGVQQPYEGVSISLSAKTLHSFAVNLYAALPLSHLSSPTQGLLPAWRDVLTGLPGVLLVFGAVGYGLLGAAAAGLRSPRPSIAPAAAIGLALLVLPAALLSLSLRYQGEFTDFGDSYTQVFLEVMGVALLISAALGRLGALVLSPLQRMVMRCVVGLICALVAGCGFGDSARAVYYMNTVLRAGDREVLSTAIRRGLLDDVPLDQGVYFDSLPWLIPEFFPQFDEKLAKAVFLKVLTPTEQPVAGALRVRIVTVSGRRFSLSPSSPGVVLLSRYEHNPDHGVSEKPLKLYSVRRGADSVTTFFHAAASRDGALSAVDSSCAPVVPSSDVAFCSPGPDFWGDPISILN